VLVFSLECFSWVNPKEASGRPPAHGTRPSPSTPHHRTEEDLCVAVSNSLATATEESHGPTIKQAQRLNITIRLADCKLTSHFNISHGLYVLRTASGHTQQQRRRRPTLIITPLPQPITLSVIHCPRMAINATPVTKQP